MNNPVRSLEPRTLWNNFENINAIPRASRKEKAVAAYIEQFGEKRGLDTRKDTYGNVLIRKPGTPGMEKHPVVILQCHLDMVHQKNSDTVFDFDKEGIRSYIDGDWVKAQGTTLGADNGIGVAAMMSILESKDMPHPPLEALFTVEEEIGMGGAMNLEKGFVSGKTMLNMDTEQDDTLIVGCAGGVDLLVDREYNSSKVNPDKKKAYNIIVKGLRGGHSGIDIHLGHANANKLLVRVLYELSNEFPLYVSEIDGGGLRNAIPREGTALVVVDDRDKALMKKLLEQLTSDIKAEYAVTDPDIRIYIEETIMPEIAMDANIQKNLLRALYAVHDGVFRMNPTIEELVETSSNLARMVVKLGLLHIEFHVRSMAESSKKDMANAVRCGFEVLNCNITEQADYPGWKPEMTSPVLAVMKKVYEKIFSKEPQVVACHAGLECGIIGARFGKIDMISFGPTMRFPHSPNEKVSICSVSKFWDYLREVLKNL